MKPNNHMSKKIYIFLLACLILSPATPLIAAPGVEQRLSDVLCSPLRQDMDSVSMCWVNSHRSTLINFPTQEEADSYNAKFFLAATMGAGYTHDATLPRPRQALLESLQFLGRPGQRSVLVGIDRTITRAGQFSLFSLLAQEVTDWDIIKNRQAFVRHLVNNPDSLKNIQTFLRKIQSNERVATQAMQESMGIAQKAARNKKGTSLSSKSDSVSNAGDLWNTMFFTLIGVAALGRVGYKIAEQIAPGKVKLPDIHSFLSTQNHTAADIYSKHVVPFAKELYTSCSQGLIYNAINPIAIYFHKAVDIQLAKHPNMAKAIDTLGAVYVAQFSYKLIKARQATFARNYALAHATAQVCRNALLLQEEIAHLDHVNELYNDILQNASPAWNSLAAKIKSPTFDGSGAPKSALSQILFTHNGRTENTVQSLHGAKSELGTLIRFYAELDAYQSMAQFYLDNQTTKNSFGENIHCCFTDFVENSQESVLHAQTFWNPIIPTDRVRPSSLMLGQQPDAGTDSRNLIITGANAGGKSVSLKAVIINILLSQTFGIACAESFKLTPFKKIIARMMSADDTASDKSKFLLEAEEVAIILKEVMSLEPTEHAFVETDELFSGTEVGPAICLSMELCARIAQMKNVMYVLATHYKQLTDLKRLTGNIFDNYKVSVNKDPVTGKLIYPYSLTQGIGNTNVAFDIFLEQLKSQGINDATLIDIINKAKQRQEALESQLEHITFNGQPTAAAAA